MKVLVIGSGGREHALAWLIAKSDLVTQVFCAPGNAGTTIEAKTANITINPNEIDQLAKFARDEQIDLTVVGPEDPLANGIVDFFSVRFLPIFGPTEAAAQLESSKSFAKGVMVEAGVPTPHGRCFIDSESAFRHLHRINYPCVIKADGLALGKGVTICRTFQEAEKTVHAHLVDGKFGQASSKILIEDFADGHPGLLRAEISVMAIVDQFGHFIMLPPAQDYKPIEDGDHGPNTGGMGSFAPVPWVTPSMIREIGSHIFQPVISTMIKRGAPFSGVLYAGLIYTETGFQVLEFNVRFGDPELQALAMLMNFDIVPLLKTVADGQSISRLALQMAEQKVFSGHSVCVVLASPGYPGNYEKGRVINFVQVFARPGKKLIHAGTKLNDQGVICTNGGRVLNVCASGGMLLDARAAAYQVIGLYTWEDSQGFHQYYRTDIAKDVETIV